MSVDIWIPGQPPRTTAQEKGVTVTPGGKVRFYEKQSVKDARAMLTAYLLPQRPRQPLPGPLALTVTWGYRARSAKLEGTPKITRPDTDNLEKLLKDVMTDCRYWEDDAQVATEHVEKIWTMEPGIRIRLERIPPGGHAYGAEEGGSV